MKILDRYVAKNFLIGYAISFAVLLGLCIVIDLFVNIDEFAEEKRFFVALSNIGIFYVSRVTLWFRDLAGMIVVIAAVFSLTRMTRNNELIAVMASGMSLKRILAPILFLSVLLTFLQVLDQEFVIPRMANMLSRTHDDIRGERKYAFWFLTDSNDNLFSARVFSEAEKRMGEPVIILRETDEKTNRKILTGRIEAKEAFYDTEKGGWELEDGRKLIIPEDPEVEIIRTVDIDFFKSDLSPREIPLRNQKNYKSLLSTYQLDRLIRSQSTRPADMADLYMQKHVRITDPIINIIMLMIALPVLVCRDPKQMKTAIMTSFTLTSLCFTVTFLSKLFSTEFAAIRPEIWAWLPIFIFLPVAFVQIDSMKT